jgi:hypothetical protein
MSQGSAFEWRAWRKYEKYLSLDVRPEPITSPQAIIWPSVTLRWGTALCEAKSSLFLTVKLRKWKYEVAAVSAMKVYGSVEVELHLLTSGLDGGDWLTSQSSFKT